ncbi:hypothetical protein B0T18DRAFT_445484 [Schizothecium vesticola]|uniref:Uncharacterized protein n=1 Tax=Schizothecium vesticola TaxID=314040 RepID=A0AA40F1T9_9PEZI|nr:hypothetical protein B0T18DRAFT_445484 [Schizothecium vesticola]
MSNNGSNANSSSSNYANSTPYPDDGEVERTLLTNLCQQLVEIRDHYESSHGRVLKAKLETLQSLADERLQDLDQWDEPEEGDTANIAEYAAARTLATSLRRIIARIWTVDRTKSGHLSAPLIQELEDLVDARVEAERSQ